MRIFGRCSVCLFVCLFSPCRFHPRQQPQVAILNSHKSLSSASRVAIEYTPLTTCCRGAIAVAIPLVTVPGPIRRVQVRSCDPLLPELLTPRVQLPTEADFAAAIVDMRYTPLVVSLGQVRKYVLCFSGTTSYNPHRCRSRDAILYLL